MVGQAIAICSSGLWLQKSNFFFSKGAGAGRDDSNLKRTNQQRAVVSRACADNRFKNRQHLGEVRFAERRIRTRNTRNRTTAVIYKLGSKTPQDSVCGTATAFRDVRSIGESCNATDRQLPANETTPKTFEARR